MCPFLDPTAPLSVGYVCSASGSKRVPVFYYPIGDDSIPTPFLTVQLMAWYILWFPSAIRFISRRPSASQRMGDLVNYLCNDKILTPVTLHMGLHHKYDNTVVFWR